MPIMPKMAAENTPMSTQTCGSVTVITLLLSLSNRHHSRRIDAQVTQELLR
jgi:hypothetical protein